MKKLYAFIPNLFTLANLFCGACAIVFILQTGEITIHINNACQQVAILPEKMWIGSIFIFMGAFFDFIDGFVARWLKVTSELGKQLDSLSDVVTFGVAPSMIIYQILKAALAQNVYALNFAWITLTPAFFIACAAAYRLAKFNISNNQSTYFIGMPTPAIGIIIASLPLIISQQQSIIIPLLYKPLYIYIIILILSYLMVSSIPFVSFKITNKRLKYTLFTAISLSLLSAFIIQSVAILIAWIVYIAFSIIFKNAFINKHQ